MDEFLGVENTGEQHQEAQCQDFPEMQQQEGGFEAYPAFEEANGTDYGEFNAGYEAQAEQHQEGVPAENGYGAMEEDFTSYPAEGQHQEGADGMLEQAHEEPTYGAFMDGEAIPVPAVQPAEPESEDPRVQWRKKNQKELAQRDKEEMEARMAMKSKGAEHLKKVKETREKRVSARKNENRANNNPKPEAGSAYEGTTWQKVNQLVSYTSGTHNKDVARMKTSLTSLSMAAA